MPESQVKDTAFVKFLRNRGVKLETDANGFRIYVINPWTPIVFQRTDDGGNPWTLIDNP
jgi:hypothetical protein